MYRELSATREVLEDAAKENADISFSLEEERMLRERSDAGCSQLSDRLTDAADKIHAIAKQVAY